MAESHKTSEDPSIEEILDSIRQIIADDAGDEEEKTPEPPIAPAPPKVNKPAPPPPPVQEASTVQQDLDSLAAVMASFETPSVAPASQSAVDDDVLVLTERVDEPSSEPEVSLEDVPNADESKDPFADFQIDLSSLPGKKDQLQVALRDIVEEDEAHDPVDDFASSKEKDDDSILTSTAEKAAYKAISQLARRTALEHNGITIEEIVRSELKPLLRKWLDKHLPAVIERLVSEELERVSNRALED